MALSALNLAWIIVAAGTALSCEKQLKVEENPFTGMETAVHERAAVPSASSKLKIRYFWSEGCSVCLRAAQFLDTLERNYPAVEIARYEVGGKGGNLAYYEYLAAEHKTSALVVPAFFFAGKYWMGFRRGISEEITAAVRTAISDEWRTSSGGTRQPLAGEELILPLFGRISFTDLPSYVVTGAIALVDGFNPCSLWVLTFLIGLIVRTGSRRRTLAVGLIFLFVTALVYGLFILGLFRILSAAAELSAARIGVAALAVTMGVINVKDFFAFKIGFSLTIPEKYRSVIARKGRFIFEKSGSPLGLAAATALFAFGICVIELPCTAGFPMIWSQYIASLNPEALTFWSLFALYLFVYLADELFIVAVSTAFMRRLNFGKNQARVLKLLGGTLMINIGFVYFLAPAAARTFAGVGLIFGVSLAVTAAVIFVQRLFTAGTHY